MKEHLWAVVSGRTLANMNGCARTGRRNSEQSNPVEEQSVD